MFVDWWRKPTRLKLPDVRASERPSDLDEASFNPEILDPGIPETENQGVSEAAWSSFAPQPVLGTSLPRPASTN